MLKAILKVAWVAVILNEIRGLILAVPVLYSLYLAGGTAMALWIAFCSLAGIVLSVIVPAFILRRIGNTYGQADNSPQR